MGGALQPGGLFTISSLTPTVDGSVSEWTSAQVVVNDMRGDTLGEEDYDPVTGVDVQKLYMAYDAQNLYSAITLYDNIDSSYEYDYGLAMSYSPDDWETLGSIILGVGVYNGYAEGWLYYVDLSYGYPNWNYIADFNAVVGSNAVEFSIPLADLPAELPGRFILLDCWGWNPISYEDDGEWNGTHLKIAGLGSSSLGTINGTITYDDYTGAPIFVQAYTDPWDPEDSLVAGTMINSPGAYTLTGIGIGWQGYVRAFTPLFGFDNPLELVAFDIQVSTGPVHLTSATLGGVNLVLNYPTLLAKDVWVPGEIDPNYESDWYAFDAVEGATYGLDLSDVDGPYISMRLYGRNGDREFEYSGWWQPQPNHIDFNRPATGRYYVEACDDYWGYQTEGGTYQIKMTSSTFTIGGAIYTDVNDPLNTSVPGVKVTVTGDVKTFEATTSGTQGLWQIDVAPGNYTVTPSKAGYSFQHVETGVPDGQASITINVNQANEAANQNIQFLAEFTCLPCDWNEDGFRSIIGDVPPFVDCVYFGNCPDWPEEYLLCVGDCNGDGILSIIGDVPCFVECVYFENCPE